VSDTNIHNKLQTTATKL